MQFTTEHIDKILSVIEQNPALSKRKKKTLGFGLEKFQRDFNAKMNPVLDEMFGDNPKMRADMETFFLIKEYQIFPGEPYGSLYDVFTNILHENVLILGMTNAMDADDNFKLLSFINLIPETKDEFLVTGMLMTNFLEILLPGVDVAKFLKQSAPSPVFVKKGLKFLTEAHDDLIFLTATAK